MNNLTPLHVAIIMDGNGRWARKRGLPRKVGHLAGGYNLAKVAKWAKEFSIKYLTLYAFGTDNWKRPISEVEYLMSEPIKIVKKHYAAILAANIKIRFIGFRHQVPKELLIMMEKLEQDTKQMDGLELFIAIDYGGQEEIIEAVKKLTNDLTEVTVENVTKSLWQPQPVDLMIRTSGEMRLSNFLLWQNSYAEFYFTKKHWPAFGKRDLKKAIKIYRTRERRFGGVKK